MGILKEILAKSKNKKRLVINGLLLALAIWAGWGATKMTWQAWELYQEAKDTEKQIAELAQKKEELESYIAELESRQGAEREAKARLNLKLPGEEVIVVVPEETKENQNNSFAWWKKIKEFLLNPLP